MNYFIILQQQQQLIMDFRIRPSSKKSQFDKRSERSLVELPMPKAFQQNENTILRSLSNRIDNLQSSITSNQDLWRKDRQVSNAGYLDVQKRLDMLQYKTFTTEKALKQISQLPPSTLVQPKTPLQTSQNQLNLIKQAIQHQQKMHYEHTKHQQEIDEQLNRKQMKLEQQMRELLNRQKEDLDMRWKGQVEEIRVGESVKQRKMDQQYEMMKGMVSGTERKIYEEFERKNRNQTVIKDYIEDRILSLKQEMAMEQKSIVSKQNKFVRQIRDSIQSVLSILQNTKKELEDELSETQRLSATNIKRVSMSIDLIKDKIDEQFSHIVSENNHVQSQMSQLKKFMSHKLEENRQMIMEIEEEAMNMTPNNKSRMKESKVSEVDQQNGNIKSDPMRAFKTEMKNWKQITEQKNLNVFKQISNTLKTMKIEWKKQNDEITSEVGSFKESVMNVKKSIPIEIKKSVQTIITIFNNQFDTLAEELDTIIEMVALSKKENEKYTKEEVKKMSGEIMNQVKDMISASQKESNIYTEKALAKHDQALKNHVQVQLKFLKDTFLQKNTILETQIQQLSASNKKNQLLTTAQLEDFTLKLKTFNQNYKDYLQQQRKDDLKKRIELEESMRKNANNLMDLSYKKSEFLVEGMKKAIQMNQMKDKAELTRQAEAFQENTERKFFQTKEELTSQFNGKLDKLAEQVEASQQALQEQMDQQITTVKRTFQLEIQSARQELQTTKQDLQTTKSELLETNKNIEAHKQQFLQEKQKREIEMKEFEEKSSEKIKELEQKSQQKMKQLEDKSQQSIKQLQIKNQGAIKDLQVKNEQSIKLLDAKSQDALKQLQEKLEELQTKSDEQNKKLQAKNQQAISNLEVKTNQSLKMLDTKSQEALKQLQQKIQQLQNKNQEQIQQTIKKLQNKLEELQDKGHQSTQELESTVTSLRETMWKMEAMTFSQQAKNKAIFDRMGDDINQMSANMSVLAKQIKGG